MRISSDRGDPGFRPDLIGSDVVVTLDGETVEMCVIADEAEGFVEFLSAGPDGEPFLAEDNSVPAREKKFGEVVIHLPPERWFATA